MTEDGFADDELTLLVLSDVTLFGNSDELRAFDVALVRQTQTRLLNEGYAVILSGEAPGRRGARPERARLTEKGSLLRDRLERKLRK